MTTLGSLLEAVQKREQHGCGGSVQQGGCDFVAPIQIDGQFHQSACNDGPFSELREGQAVTFERGQGPKGPRGENVRPA